MLASKKIKNGSQLFKNAKPPVSKETEPVKLNQFNKVNQLTNIGAILNKINVVDSKNSGMLALQTVVKQTPVMQPSSLSIVAYNLAPLSSQDRPSNFTADQSQSNSRFDNTSSKLIQKASIGIACLSYINEVPHILMVCKRYTYGFIDFILGKYQHGDIKNNKYIKLTLMRLFNKMTNDEKLDILSLNFSQMWYRIWLHDTKINNQYYVYKNKFESMFCVDKGKKLKKLIEKSTSIHKIWEIPKGRKKSNVESDLNCAIREFSEETNISKRQYRIIPNIKKVYSYTSDNNTTYTNTYYLAMTKQEIVPVINFNTQEQINEICDIRWMDLASVRLIDNNCRLEPFIKNIFKTIKSKHLL